MKNSSQVTYTVLLAALAVLLGSLGTLGVMSLQKPAAVAPTPPVLSLPSPLHPTTPTTSGSTGASIPTPASTTPTVPPVSLNAQQLTTTVEQKQPTLDDYRQILQETISDYWVKTYTAPRADNSSITDLDTSRWVDHIVQASVPSSLASWPTISVTPWGWSNFTIEFSKAKGSGWMNFGDSISIRYLSGEIAGVPKKDDANWGAIACPTGTAEDISFIANAFALAYPAAAEDKDLCKHITVKALTSENYKEVKAYTLDTNFQPYGIDSWGGGESTVYRPTLIMKSAKKEEMISALQLNHFAVIELNLRSIGQEKVSTLMPLADSIISLNGDLKIDGFCGYDNCY